MACVILSKQSAVVYADIVSDRGPMATLRALISILVTLKL